MAIATLTQKVVAAWAYHDAAAFASVFTEDGTMILAAPDPLTARAIVDRAETTLGTEDSCVFCSIMLSVPAAIVCAQVGDLEHAHHHLREAEGSAMMWGIGRGNR